MEMVKTLFKKLMVAVDKVGLIINNEKLKK